MAGSPSPALRKQPLPLARSILWKPTSGDTRAPSGAGDAIFVAQAALAALQDHLAAVAAPAGALGFFVGDLCEDPDIGARYLVIDSVVRLTQGVYGDHTGAVVSKIWDRVQEQVRGTKGQVLGWYHRHAPLGVELSSEDVETHLKYFDRPWQVALVLADEAGAPAAGFFRAGPDDSWSSVCLPFHELLQEESLRPGGKKRSYVTWRNYLPYNAAADRAGRGATAPRAAAPPAPSPPEPRPQPRRKTQPPQLPPLLPPEPGVATPEPLPDEEFASEAAPPAPPRPPPPPPKPRPAPRPAPGGDLPWLGEPPVAPPPPPRPPPPLRVERFPEEAVPELAPEPEPELEPEQEIEPEGGGGPGVWESWIAPIWRGAVRVLRALWRGVTRVLRGLWRALRGLLRWVARLLKLVIKLALVLALVGGVVGAAYWWFYLRTPSKPPAPRTAPRVAPRAAAPAAPPAAATPQPRAPAPPSASPFAKLDAAGDAVMQAVRAYQDQAALFARSQVGCGELARGLVGVETRWTAYSTTKRAFATLDAPHSTRDLSLYAAVDGVERGFERSECPRP